MGTSAVAITINSAEYGFWVRDHLLEAWNRLLALQMHAKTAPDFALRRALVDSYHGNGAVDDCVDKAIGHPDGLAVLAPAMDELLRRLARCGPSLELGLLCEDQMERTAEYTDTWRLIEVGKAIRGLIRGHVRTSLSDNEFFPGGGVEPLAVCQHDLAAIACNTCCSSKR